MNEELIFNAGDTVQLESTITNPDGSTRSIEGAAIVYKIAKSMSITNDNALHFSQESGISDPTESGVHIKTIAAAITAEWKSGDYLIQTQIIEDGGEIYSESVQPCKIKNNLIK